MSSQESRVDLLINNQDVPAKNYAEVRDPGKLTEIVGRVAVGSAEDVDKAVQAAHNAFLDWKKTSVKERIEKINAALKVVQDSMEDLVPLLIREHGGVIWEAQTDFGFGMGLLQYYAGIGENYLKPELIEDASSWSCIEKKAKGVVGAIIPWNMPVCLTMSKVVPALVTGNTLVVKPSPTAPLALSILLKRIAALLPDGVINVVHGDADVGMALTVHPLVKKIGFTGGTITGAQVSTNAAPFFKTITLELGGNDAAVILDDVNPAGIMPALLKGVYTRSGQICFAVKRIYVQEKMVDKFFNTMCEFVNEYKVGHGLDERASFGPVNNKNQYNKVMAFIENTKNSGATVKELGAKLDPAGWDNGYYILPHVVKDAANSSQIVSCEQFGPIIPIIPFKTVEQAIGYANDSEYGLCSSVWSGDVQRALPIAHQIEAGQTFINTHSFDSFNLGLPFGGVKRSGIGREFAGESTLSAYIDYHVVRYLK
jgi:acyl-CoA reductase-like NAD-dependent aldehyde dehydrogenase